MKLISGHSKILTILLYIVLATFVSNAQTAKDTLVIVYFDNNKSSVSPVEINKLDSFFESQRILSIKSIAGYTDSVGSSPSNFILAGKRIKSTIVLLKKFSFSDKKYTVNNFGETQPASQTDNALNRRVVISLQVMPDSSVTVAGKHDASILKKIILDKLYFKPDLPVLESFSLDYLKRIAIILKTYPDAKFEIRGHVNCPLNVPANSEYMKKMNELSEDRARTVFEIMKDDGIPAEKMTYRGMGNTEMINPYAKTDDEKRQNMRVEIFIVSVD